MKALGDLVDALGTTSHADGQLSQIGLHGLGAVLEEVRVAKVIRSLRKNGLDRGNQPLLLVRDDPDEGHVHRLHAFEDRTQILFTSERLALPEQRCSRPGIPGQVQHRRPIVELYAVAHEHDPALGAQPRPLGLLVADGGGGQGHEVPQDPPGVPLVDRNPPCRQVARNPGDRVPQTQVSLPHAQRHVQSERAVRQRQAKIFRRVKDRLRTQAVFGRAPLVPSNQMDVPVKSLNPTFTMLADVELPAAGWAVFLHGRDNQELRWLLSYCALHGGSSSSAMHIGRIRLELYAYSRSGP